MVRKTLVPAAQHTELDNVQPYKTHCTTTSRSILLIPEVSLVDLLIDACRFVTREPAKSGVVVVFPDDLLSLDGAKLYRRFFLLVEITVYATTVSSTSVTHKTEKASTVENQ